MSKAYPVDRDQLGEYLNEHGLTGSGVEVGCANGQYTARVAASWRGKELWMVDPWVKQDSSIYREITNDITDFNSWMDQCNKLAESDDRIRVMQNLSVDGAKRFQNESLDWVYLDGNHSREAVSDDLAAWWPKIKPGGIIGGHDFVDKDDEGWYCQVEMAVREWTRKMGLEFHVTNCTSWWVLKPVLAK